MAEDLLEKIPVKKRWEITAKILTNLIVMKAVRIRYLFATEEGVIAPSMAWEKYEEINTKIWSEGGRKFIPWVKGMFNIPVEDAIGADKLIEVAAALMVGPELETEIVEATAEKAISRITKCPWWVRNLENGLTPELMICPTACHLWGEEGLKAVNPKLSYKITKSMPWRDPYCEFGCEFKEE